VLTSNADTFKTLQIGDKIHLPIEREKREDLKEKAPLKKAGPTPQAHSQTLPSAPQSQPSSSSPSPNPPTLSRSAKRREKEKRKREKMRLEKETTEVKPEESAPASSLPPLTAQHNDEESMETDGIL